MLSKTQLVAIALISLPAATSAQQRTVTGWTPVVAFSATQHRTCLVDVDDEFPAVTLTDVDGSKHDLTTLAEADLSVVAFWNDQLVGGVQLRNTISRLVGPTEVKLITIYVGDSPANAKEITDRDQANLGTHLVDDAQLWEQVAKKSQPPRLFLLKGRKVIWLDIEFSLGTQQELLNAIRHYSK